MTLLEPTRDKPFRVVLRVRTARVRVCMAAVYVTVAGSVWAHGISVDGSAADGILASPPNTNTGQISMNAAREGAYDWTDVSGDARSNLNAPDNDADGTREVLASHAATRLDGAGTHDPVRRSAHDPRAV